MTKERDKTPESFSSLESTNPNGINLEDKSKQGFQYLIGIMLKYKASDLHLKLGRAPLFRIKGKLVPAKMPPLDQKQIYSLLSEVLSEKQKGELESKRQIDFSIEVAHMGRYRCNVYFQKGSLAAAVRVISGAIPNIDTLNLPPILKEICAKKRGLFLITGATGAGKSTSLAAMIQYINENHAIHVVCIEDPIEFVFHDLKASITQREIGSDISNYHEAMSSVLRQDPDVIMLGELRDPVTIQAAITAAETGHLVVATLHTNDAKSTIERILDVFPADAQNQIRVQLASTLIGVLSQQLVNRADGTSRIPVCEVMIKSPLIETHIMKNEINQIPQAITNSNGYYNMISMNQALQRLIQDEVITLAEALKVSPNPDDLRLLVSGMDRSEGYQPT